MPPDGEFTNDTTEPESRLSELRSIEDLQGPVESPQDHDPTDHLALIYETQAEQFGTIIPFIRQGLRKGDRCLYIVHDNTRADVLAALRASDIDVDAAIDSGQLTVRTATDIYFEDGEFDPGSMLSTVEGIIEDAQENDETIRSVGEMTWLEEDGVDIEDVFAYESELNALLSGADVVGVCQYNRDRIPDRVLRDVIRTHPHLISENTITPNVYYTPADETRDREEPDDIDAVLRSLRNYTDVQVTLEAQEQFLRDLYDVASTAERSFGERIEAMLELGCEYFDLEFGAVAHIESRDTQDGFESSTDIDYDINVMVGAVPEEFESGQPVQPEPGCFCRQAITQEQPVGTTDVRERDWNHDALYQKYGFTSYFGVKIVIGTQTHGTLWFGSQQPRDDPFSDAEHTLLELMGQWVSYEIEMRERERQLRRQSTITTVPDHSFGAKLQELFDLGCERFGLELGVMARIDSATDRFEITHTSHDHDHFEPGLELPLSETFCTVPEEETNTVSIPGDTDAEDIYIYRKFGLKTYLGTYVRIDGDFDRTLFFVSAGNRTESFSAGERGFLQLLGQWAKYELERQAREDRLASLTTLSRTLQDAETPRQVCNRVLNAAEPLDIPVLAVALEENSALQWEVRTGAAGKLLENEFTLADGLAKAALEADEPQREPNPIDGESTAGQSVTEIVAFPMGDHGVLLVGTFVPDGFSLSDIDILMTVASHTAVALTRTLREQKLQEREAQLQAKNETLERLNRINELVQDVVRAFVTEPTKSEIQQTVCERLATADFYEAVWIGERSLTKDVLTPGEVAGIDADRLSERLAENAPGLAESAVESEQLQVVDDVADDPTMNTPELLESNDIKSALAAPITYRDTVHGALVVYADQSFEDRQQSILHDLGETLGFALTAIDRKQALITDEAVRLDIKVREQSHFFSRVTAETDATIELQGAIPQSDGSTLVYDRVVGVSPQAVLDHAEQDETVQHARIVDEGAQDAFMEFVVRDLLMVDTFGEYGATVVDAVASDGESTIAVELPSTVEIRPLLDAFQERFPDSELVSKRSVDRPVQTAAGFRAALTERLTDKQRTVLRAAYLSGYFDRPRTSAGGEIADTLGLSSSTFHQHLRVALRKLLYAAFDEHSMP